MEHFKVVVDLLVQYQMVVKVVQEKLVELVVIGVKMVQTQQIQVMVEQQVKR